MTDPLWRFKAEAANLKEKARAERAISRDCEVRAQAYDQVADIMLGTISHSEKDAEKERVLEAAWSDDSIKRYRELVADGCSDARARETISFEEAACPDR
jgi:hypothetical protein